MVQANEEEGRTRAMKKVGFNDTRKETERKTTFSPHVSNDQTYQK